MKDFFILCIHLLTTLARLLGPGGAKAVIADSLLMKQQLLVMSRTRRPSVSNSTRMLFDASSPHITSQAQVMADLHG